jgi:hypothetical protein
MINKDGQKIITTAWIVLLDQVRLKKLAKLLPNYEVLVRQLISADEKIKKDMLIYKFIDTLLVTSYWCNTFS